MNITTDIDHSAVTAETRRAGCGVEWSLRFDGIVVADGWAETLSGAFRAIGAARADRGAIVDRVRFARGLRG